MCADIERVAIKGDRLLSVYIAPHFELSNIEYYSVTKFNCNKKAAVGIIYVQ